MAVPLGKSVSLRSSWRSPLGTQSQSKSGLSLSWVSLAPSHRAYLGHAETATKLFHILHFLTRNSFPLLKRMKNFNSIFQVFNCSRPMKTKTPFVGVWSIHAPSSVSAFSPFPEEIILVYFHVSLSALSSSKVGTVLTVFILLGQPRSRRRLGEVQSRRRLRLLVDEWMSSLDVLWAEATVPLLPAKLFPGHKTRIWQTHP